MAGILNSNLEENETPYQTPLTVEGCLGEFNDGLKADARYNLNVYSKEEVYKRDRVDQILSESINLAFNEHLYKEDDPYITLSTAEEIIKRATENFITYADQYDFIDPAKLYANKILNDHLHKKDPHNILQEVLNKLDKSYCLKSDYYSKDKLYTKDDINELNKLYIKKDGSVGFTRPLPGVDPTSEYHLTTRRYVDNTLYNHIIEADAHGFKSLLNKRLQAYAKLTNVYDRSQTYSRTLIDSIIRKLVKEAMDDALIDHLNEFDPHGILSEVRKEKYVKQDGSVPFKESLRGVDAVDPYDLVTYHQVTDLLEKLLNQISNNQPIWKTSGPVESTVGLIDDNTPVPDLMTIQEVLDAIFYGKGISISAPEYITVNKEAPITLCIHGSTALIKLAELYQNNKLITTFNKEDFDNGCITVNSLPIDVDTEIIFKVYYTNESIHEETITIKVALPVFVGLLPKWKDACNLNWSDLKELNFEEPENNIFIDSTNNLNLVSINYNFQDSKLRYPFIVVPENYANLDNMSISSLQFGIKAFEVIGTFLDPEIGSDLNYKIYVYRLALSSLNLEVTFNFA